MTNDGDIYAEIIELRRELNEYKERTHLAIGYTFDLLFTSVNLEPEQKMMIQQIRQALGEDDGDVQFVQSKPKF